MKFHEKEFVDFYYDLTGFNPYDYQVKVAECLVEGKNVILSVPTGAGKTWASIMPFLFLFFKQNDSFPKKLIYSLPLRALCNSIAQDVNKAVEKTAFEGLSAIQTGEFSEDKYFEKDIIYSTIDQTLSNFLCFPLPLSQRQANVNAGALIGSYLVFDEFHLLDSQRSMATTLGMLRMLGNLSRFCIMTATLSDGFMEKIKGALDDTEIITLDGFDEDVAKIGSLKVPEGKLSKKKINIASGIIRAEKIKENHLDKTIVICNRVETAQRVYLELEDWAGKNNINLICLHSRFFDRHRKATEKQLKELFGKEVKNKKTNSILISTQVIEAGMDISCEVMHTEIAPINALLQRVGRCARYEGEYGKVFVYDVLKEEEKAKINIEDFKDLSNEDKKEIRKLKNLYLPYEEPLCKLTFEKLKLPENQQLNEEVTIRLVNEILTTQEEIILNQLQTTNYNWSKIKDSWRDCSKSHYRHTIRNIQSANAVIIRDKSFAESHPYSLEDIGMYKWSLVKWIKEVLETVDIEEDWVVGVVEDSNLIGEDLDEGDTNLDFRAINDIAEIIKTFDTLYLNVKYFQYDEFIGFNKIRGNDLSNFKEWKNKEKEVFGAYRKDTFIQHTTGLLGAFKKEFLPSMNFPFKAFNQVFGSIMKFKELIQLILILHDYGKLDDKWQDWMQEYQEELSKMPNSPYTFEKGIPLGHTGFNTRAEKALFDDSLERATKAIEERIFKKRGKRPSHSGVGAKIIADILDDQYDDEDLYENIFVPASIAIARHHGVTNFTYPTSNISSHNYQYIQEVLKEYGMDEYELEQTIEDAGELEVMGFDQHEQFLLYLFFVRILRLCDQKATDDFEKYISE